MMLIANALTNFLVEEDRSTTWMQVLEARNVIDFGVDDDPLQS